MSSPAISTPVVAGYVYSEGVTDDTLVGTSSSDIFLFTNADATGTDTIINFDFGAGADVIDLSRVITGNDIDAEYFTVTDNGTDTTIAVDFNGASSGDTGLTIVLEDNVATLASLINDGCILL